MAKQYEAPLLTRVAGIEEVTLGGPYSGFDQMSMMMMEFQFMGPMNQFPPP